MTFRPLLASPRTSATSRAREVRRRLALFAALALGGFAVAALASGRQTASAAGACDVSATPATFNSAVSAAVSGQTICLASGNYGTWNGVNKAITITAANGASPPIRIAFKSGVGGFTLDGIANLSGTIFGGSNITIQNSTFTNASCTVVTSRDR